MRARERRRSTPPPRPRAELERLAAQLPHDSVEQLELVDVPVGRPPWHATGIELSAGDRVTTFAAGRVQQIPLLDVWGEPAHQLWFRVAPGGTLFRGTRDSHSFFADTPGSLEVASHPPGDWSDRSGTHRSPRRDYLPVRGGLSVLVVRWAAGADDEAVLRGLADGETGGLPAAELERRASGVRPPSGWGYLWSVGDAEIYSPDGEDGIGCLTHRDVGILQRALDAPLTGSTRLRWDWRVDELPSELAEDTLPTHDYMSIALEFDNGQDLTWHWSAELPPEYSYRCPIPTWRHRETHMVVRTGTAELGRWLAEERAVLRDYERAIGGPPPERIVKAWLIAVSIFQRGRGACAYRNIEVV